MPIALAAVVMFMGTLFTRQSVVMAVQAVHPDTAQVTTAQVIAAVPASGSAVVDMRGDTWAQEKAIKKELEAAGYKVDFHSTTQALNGALEVRRA